MSTLYICGESSGLYYAKSHRLFCNLTDMHWKPLACFSLCVSMVPEVYQWLATSMQSLSIPFLSLKLIWWLPGDCQGNSPQLIFLYISYSLSLSLFIFLYLFSLLLPSYILLVVLAATVTVMVTVTWYSRWLATEPLGSAGRDYIKYWANLSPYRDPRI
jgi:hypothetical protein